MRARGVLWVSIRKVTCMNFLEERILVCRKTSALPEAEKVMEGEQRKAWKGLCLYPRKTGIFRKKAPPFFSTSDQTCLKKGGAVK